MRFLSCHNVIIVSILFTFIEMLLAEIFSFERKYVIFASGKFELLFKLYNIIPKAEYTVVFSDESPQKDIPEQNPNNQNPPEEEHPELQATERDQRNPADVLPRRLRISSLLFSSGYSTRFSNSQCRLKSALPYSVRISFILFSAFLSTAT